MNQKEKTQHIRGYVEGYYGKLLTWQERTDLVESLASFRLNTYCYAPKEDPQHRFKWREPHTPHWHSDFQALCKTAANSSVALIAGIAPGLDYTHSTVIDFNHLKLKAQQYINDGASGIMLLWDDIDDEFSDNIAISEGTAHARTVNQLSEALGQPIWTVPRVYATEIKNTNNYLEDFFTELQPQHTVLICGTAIVASSILTTDLRELSRTECSNLHKAKAAKNSIQKNMGQDSSTAARHRTVVWDNFYANDYCPRRLFIGPWTGREEVNDYLINPTGMLYTDLLILDIATTTHTAKDKHVAWRDALKRHGVPTEFLTIARYFESPCFGDWVTVPTITPNNYSNAQQRQHQTAIEHCLWRWKSPLAREWYPFIMSLKHDLALAQGALPIERILKTQSECLASHLTHQLLRP